MKQKNFLKILCITSLIVTQSFSQNSNGTIDAAGDIAIIGMNKTNTPSKSDFAFVLLDECPNGTSIIFDDDEWEGTDWASTTGEGAVTWTNDTGRTLGIGTVIQIASGNDSPTVNLGSAIESDLGFNLSDDDQLYSYTGTFRGTPTDDGVIFLTFRGDLAINTATLTGTGLTSGTTALDTPNPLGFYSNSKACNGTLASCSSDINSEGTSWTDGVFTWPTGVATFFNGSAIPITWNGTTSNDWNTTSNWSNNALQDSNSHITVPNSLTNYPTVTTAETINSLTIASGATLVATNAGFTVSGNATYTRNLPNGSQWYLMGVPVSGENYNNTWVTDNSIPSSTLDVDNRGISWYDNSSSDTDSDGGGTSDSATGFWRYMAAGDDNPFAVARGYGIIRSSAGDVSFIGSGIYSSNQTFSLTQGLNNFNLVGNPFTAFITLGTFHTTNTSNIGTDFFFWNGGPTYVTKLSGTDAAYEIAPGQGFFVEATNTNNVTFEITDASHQGSDTFGKTTNQRPEVHLSVNDGNGKIPIRILYIDGTTKGYDVGYDGKLFDGVSYNFIAYSDLVESNGIKYQTQSLPNTDHETMIIPIGLKATANKEITFTAEALNIPNGLHVYLEDRQTGDVTSLDKTNAEYKVTLTENLDGIGRFYLHTRTNSTLSTDDVLLNSVRIFSPNPNTLRIAGLQQGNASVRIFNMLGKQVVNKSLITSGVSDVDLPNLANGVYIVQLETANGSINKKITLD